VKRKNGHRVWEAYVKGRVSRPLRLWRPVADPSSPDRPPEAQALELVLVTPDHGTAILALEAVTGAEVAIFELPENGAKLYGAPLVTPDGKIVVARQEYNETEATLMVFDLSDPPGRPGVEESGL
jgi:hypothetical protein